MPWRRKRDDQAGYYDRIVAGIPQHIKLLKVEVGFAYHHHNTQVVPLEVYLAHFYEEYEHLPFTHKLTRIYEELQRDRSSTYNIILSVASHIDCAESLRIRSMW